MEAMFASSWRSPAAGVRWLRRSSWSSLSSTMSAAVFSSTRATRRVPGIGAMSSPWASSQARAICAGVAPVVLGDVLGGADLAGQKAVAERGVRDEADTEAAQQREQFGLGVAGPQRVLGLQRGERVDGVGAADRVRAGLGQADVAHLALGDQVGQGADGLLDGRVRVDPVLVVEIGV